MEFPEYKCNNKDNKERKNGGLIAPGYTCEQLHSRRTLYRDEDDEPIRAQIRYKAGCELRCVDKDCNKRTNLKMKKTRTDVHEKSQTPILVTKKSLSGINGTDELHERNNGYRIRLKDICRELTSVVGETMLCKTVV